MQLKVNKKQIDVADGASIGDVLRQLSLPLVGIAVAVGGVMVARAEWERYTLKDADELIVIRAACGG